MNRIVFAVFMCIIVLSACTKSDKPQMLARPSDIASTAPSPSTGVAPEIISASLYPEKPTASTKLIAHYTLRNPEVPGVTLVFRWFVDNVMVQEDTVGMLDPGMCGKGSEIYAEIIPSNQFGAGKPVKTNVLTICNLPPVVSSISLAPVDPPVGAIITATAVGTDPDGDTLTFSTLNGVRAKTEGFSLERAAEACDHMMSGKPGFAPFFSPGLQGVDA